MSFIVCPYDVPFEISDFAVVEQKDAIVEVIGISETIAEWLLTSL